MTSLSDYETAFDCIRFRREGGILEIALHTNGGSFVFDEKTHHDFGTAFRAPYRRRLPLRRLLLNHKDRLKGAIRAIEQLI